jgi:hypothetical protein
MPPKIEILYFTGCPNYEPALERVRAALRAEGVEAPVELVAVETEAEATRQDFYGSPTVRVDGRDVVSPPSGATPTLACRMYRTESGRLSPFPPIAAVLAAVRGAPGARDGSGSAI